MLLKGIFLSLFGIGLFLLVQVVMPFVAFKAWELTSLDQEQVLVDPRPSSKRALVAGFAKKSDVLGVSVSNVGNFPAFVGTSANPIPYKEFKLSVPKLGLKDVQVFVSSNDIDTGLVHLPGSALPGQKGNVFISGHSSLTPILQKKGAQAVFVKLPNVKKGDEIELTALGQKLTYEVIGLKIVDPKDYSIIDSPDSEGRYLTLMTCVPPGYNTKRLVVLARLKN